MTRVDELRDLRGLDSESVHAWIARQVDEVEDAGAAQIAGLRLNIEELSVAVDGLRSVLTKILIALVTGLVLAPIGVVWAVAAG